MKKRILAILVTLSLFMVYGCRPYNEFMYGFNQGLSRRPYLYGPNYYPLPQWQGPPERHLRDEDYFNYEPVPPLNLDYIKP